MGIGGFVWSSIIVALSEKRRAYALDTIGDVGKSKLDDPDRYPKKGRDYSSWLDDVYDELDIAKPDVVAGSMGGWIALNRAIYARSRPQPGSPRADGTSIMAGHPRRPGSNDVECPAPNRCQEGEAY
jgi:pimeloyl-ACP methyl ester carboxylesterase